MEFDTLSPLTNMACVFRYTHNVFSSVLLFLDIMFVILAWMEWRNAAEPKASGLENNPLQRSQKKPRDVSSCYNCFIINKLRDW